MGRITIEYSTLPRSTDRRVRRIRNFGLLAMAFALLVRYEPPARRLATNAWWRYQCARYTVPSDQVAFLGPLWDYSSAPNPPLCFNNLVGTTAGAPVLFLHRLKSSRGSCVVAVTLTNSHFTGGDDSFDETMQVDCVEINRDGSFTKMVTDWNDADITKPSRAPTLTDLTIFAGQVDQSDPSAFSIKYSAREERGCIFGRLEDDGKIHFHANQNLVNWNGQICVRHGALPTDDSGGI